MPIHNAAPFLETTLDSLLSQNYGDWEAILLDDASSDGSDRIAEAYVRAHPDRFRLVHLRENVGVVAARNRAVEAAGGAELIALLDHDDWLREDYLERMVTLHDSGWEAGRRIGIVACDARLFGPRGFHRKTWGERLGWNDHVDLDSLIGQNTIFARALFRRSAFAEVGGFIEDCIGSDDWDLWLRMVEAGYDVAVTREPLAVYRIHEGGMSRDRLLMAEATLTVFRRLLGRGRLSGRQQRAVRRRMAYFRGVRARELLRRAYHSGNYLSAARLAVTALPQGAVGLLCDRPRQLRLRASRRAPRSGAGRRQSRHGA